MKPALALVFYNYLIPRPLLVDELKSSAKELIDTPKEKEDEKLSIKSGNNTPIYGLPSILDSLIRGIGRFYETKIENYFNRIGFRFITENIRYSSSRIMLNLFQKQAIGLDILATGLKKSLEIAIGTAIVDPNREAEHLKRISSGFANMIARLGTRVGLVGLKILDKSQFSFKTLVDEFVSRTICRVLYIDSENPIIGIGCRTLEQFAINEWVRNLPLWNQIITKFHSKETDITK